LSLPMVASGDIDSLVSPLRSVRAQKVKAG
jgi:hypothetical protein